MVFISFIYHLTKRKEKLKNALAFQIVRKEDYDPQCC